MLRKEGNVYVLDLFLRVPIVYTPMEVVAINEVADGREPRMRVTFDCNSPTFLTAGAVSVEDRSKRAETVRPQLDERCEKRQECDSVLNVTNDEKWRRDERRDRRRGHGGRRDGIR